MTQGAATAQAHLAPRVPFQRVPVQVAAPKTWGPAAQSAHALLSLHIQIPQHSTFRALDQDSAGERVSYTHPHFQLKATIQDPLPLQDWEGGQEDRVGRGE